jgi:hypothetical protein
MRRAFVALSAYLMCVAPAAAEWAYVEQPSSFRPEADYSIGARDDFGGVVVRCRKAAARLYYIREHVPSSLERRLGEGTIEGVFRIDHGPVETKQATYSLSNGRLVVEFPVNLDLVSGLAGARDRFAVALMLNGNIVYESRFGVEAAREAAGLMLANCRA